MKETEISFHLIYQSRIIVFLSLTFMRVYELFFHFIYLYLGEIGKSCIYFRLRKVLVCLSVGHFASLCIYCKAARLAFAETQFRSGYCVLVLHCRLFCRGESLGMAQSRLYFILRVEYFFFFLFSLSGYHAYTVILTYYWIYAYSMYC